MRDVFDWWSEEYTNEYTPQCNEGCAADCSQPAKPWLLLGKGPTFHQHRFQNLREYHTIVINHAVREVCVDVSSVVDIDVIAACAEDIDANARFLLMPRYPYDWHGKQSRALASYFDELPILRKLSDEGRLICYNLGGEHCACDDLIVPPGTFSAEILVNLLASLGARKIRTMGVDGGKRYDGAFTDLEGLTCLKNGHSSFDVQFEGIARAVRRYGLDYAALALPPAVQQTVLHHAYARGLVRNLFPLWLRDATRPLRHEVKRWLKHLHDLPRHSDTTANT